MSETVCFICQKDLSSGEKTVVKEKGVKSLCESSKLRKNTDHTRLLGNLKQVTVHKACQKNYTNPKIIKAYVNRGYQEAVQTAVAARVRSKADAFNFKDNCFLCGEGLTEAFKQLHQKKPHEHKYQIRKVMTFEVKDTFVEAAKLYNQDDWGEKIISRLQDKDLDLVALDAWYHEVCSRKLRYDRTAGRPTGRPPSGQIDRAMNIIFSYLEEHSDECQFSVEDLLSLVDEDHRPDKRTLKSRLFQKYNDDMLYVERSRQTAVICFRNVGHKILGDNFYMNRKSDTEEERIRVVKAAADIVLEDIRSVVYDVQEYSPPDNNFLSDAHSAIPATLLAFLNAVIIKHKRGDLEKWRKKVVALSHAIIAAARPNSFLSPVLLGTSVYLYKKFGSKILIELISSLGFSASYSEALRFEASCVLKPQRTELAESAFCQFVFDNADRNINTLDGLNTFHSMGGVMCVTPGSAILPQGRMKRLPICSSAEIVQGSGTVQVKFCKMKDGLKNITVRDLDIANKILPSFTDIIWSYGNWVDFPDHPGWNGFMEGLTNQKDYSRSAIIYLPFINAPPTNSDTVYTSIWTAVDKCREIEQKSCVVTFDQPLYMKAMEIVHSGDPDFKNVFVRLGGFHLLMSYNGCIGEIMKFSGLKDLLSLIYAPNSVDKILTGHAYGRAVRAHILVQNALAQVIWDTVQLSEEERGVVKRLLKEDQSLIFDANDENKGIVEKFCMALEALEANGPTSRLWVQYFKMVSLMKQFIEAERMGNWDLHLDTIKKMLPFFHAAGHFQYAKSAHLYIQDMMDLKEKMDPNEFNQFTRQGCFTIRRSEKFWSGIWSDMTIEQTLMRSSKVRGGLSSGRGFHKESVLAKWTQGNIHLQYVCDAMESYCQLTAVTSEQHVDARPTRVARDKADTIKLKKWLADHPPFAITDVIMSISNGVVGGESVNCYLAQEKGKVTPRKLCEGQDRKLFKM